MSVFNIQVGVLIFTERDPGNRSTFEPEEVLSILTNFPLALALYLEFLVNEQQSQVSAVSYTQTVGHM